MRGKEAHRKGHAPAPQWPPIVICFVPAFPSTFTRLSPQRHRVRSGFPTLRRTVARVFTEFPSYLLGFSRLSVVFFRLLKGRYRILLGFTGFYWVLLGFTGLNPVFQGSTGF